MKAEYQTIAQARGLSAHVVQALCERRAFTQESLSSLPENVLRRAIRRLQYPDLPRARERFRAQHLRSDPSMGLAGAAAVATRRIDAIRHQDSLRIRTIAERIAGIPVGLVASSSLLSPLPQPSAAGVDSKSWTALGPGNVGGRTRCICLDPDHPRRIWAGSAGGGVWRSDDSGESWMPADDLMANLAVCSLAISPIADERGRRAMFAGTGEGFDNGDAIRGAGIFSSTDGSQWAQLASTNSPEFSAVNRIAISGDGKVMLAATLHGLMRSEGPDFTVWKNTLSIAIADVRCHPSNPAAAVAGGLANGEAYYSEDTGKTWYPAKHDEGWGGRVEITYAVADPRTVYASVNYQSGALWRSTNGGKDFARMSAQSADGKPIYYLGDQGWYANAIWAGDSTDANAVIVGGLDLWVSTDAGATLRQISLWYQDGSVHADQHCIVGAVGKPGTVYFGNDGGIFCADDYRTVGTDNNHTQGWSSLDNGYGVTQFYGGAGNANGIIIGGAQDNGTVRCALDQGANAWTTMFGGDGGWCSSDASDVNTFFGEYVYGQICRSVDAGVTAEYICGQYWDSASQKWLWRPAPYVIPDARSNQALFIAPFSVDMRKSGRILVGGMALWRTEDAKTANDDTKLTGPTWTSIKDSAGDAISAIAIAPADSDVIWVGHSGGQLFTTSSGASEQPSWRQVAGPGGFPLAVARYCSSIFVAPDDSNNVYVTFAAYREDTGNGNVWRTPDGGATWQDLGQSLPNAPVHKISRHPTQASYLYAGTEIGLYASEDDGATWSPTNEGPTNCPVYDLFWMNKQLVCTTHGRGMFKIEIGG